MEFNVDILVHVYNPRTLHMNNPMSIVFDIIFPRSYGIGMFAKNQKYEVYVLSGYSNNC